MTIATLFGWSLTLAALSLSIFALFAVRRTSGRSLSKQLSALSTRLESIEADQELLKQQTRLDLKRLHARLATQRYRQRVEDGEAGPSESSAPGQSGEDDKARVRAELSRKLALGEINAGVPVHAAKR